MFDSTKSDVNKVSILVHIRFPSSQQNDEDLEEFKELSTSAGLIVADIITGSRQIPDSKYFIGEGKLVELEQSIKQHNAQIVLFNHILSPAQVRNLEKHLHCSVLDRTELILDIFAQRARTFEGKLQVELAQLKHLSSRLIRGWTHLERQKGGIGLRGPGETQLETDRRLIGHRIKTITKRLDKIRSQRYQIRQKRVKAEISTVSIVGYTNAGKSTLFNSLSSSNVYAANQLFATLDPTLRRLDLPGFGPVILADTVGFIRHLPHELIDAFRATLEETHEASLLLHIVDYHSEKCHDNILEVEKVLKQIEADEVPVLMVFNKIDLSDQNIKPHIDYDEEGKPIRVWISALKHEGLNLLKEAVVESLSGQHIHCCVILNYHQAYIRAKLYELGVVIKEISTTTGKFTLEILISRAYWDQLFYSH